METDLLGTQEEVRANTEKRRREDKEANSYDDEAPPQNSLLDSVEVFNAEEVEGLAHDDAGGGAEEEALGLSRVAEDLALGDELGELGGELVEEVAEAGGLVLVGDGLDDLGEEAELEGEGAFLGVGGEVVGRRAVLRLEERGDVGVGLAEDGGEAGVGEEEVDGGVARGREHFVVGELVVGFGVLVQVEVLDAAVADDGGCFFDLLFVQRTLAVLDARLQAVAHPVDGGVEEIDEADGVAGPRLEALAVVALDDAEADVPQLVVLRVEPAGDLGGLEAHVEVISLAQVCDVHEPVLLQVEDAVPQRGHVRRVVAVAPVRLAQNQRIAAARQMHEHGVLLVHFHERQFFRGGVVAVGVSGRRRLRSSTFSLLS
mmetsp:Transcript_5045/g.15851  ORF Transcript_5045/g.15851 Transcript_5045/m.15851 type:complete len:373 (-) Transcript_5045:1373-2491(-)